jgi:undecaprenyl-diphosphatase
MSRRERRSELRRHQLLWDLFFGALRAIFRRAQSFGTTLGVFLASGMLVAGLATFGFAELAGDVMGGDTQGFDEAALRWVEEHHRPMLDVAMVEISMLGTWIVVLTIAVVAGLFLYLTNHKYSALLLLVSTTGGIALNSILKMGFARPRPSVFEWKTHVMSSSFPSGHAMSAVVIYGTVAYLAARLQRTHLARLATLAAAGAMMVLICLSRMYLGVHYPSDVAAGAVIGLAWAAFCMATLEGIQRFAKKNAKQVLEHEEPAPAPAG